MTYCKSFLQFTFLSVFNTIDRLPFISSLKSKLYPPMTINVASSLLAASDINCPGLPFTSQINLPSTCQKHIRYFLKLTVENVKLPLIHLC